DTPSSLTRLSICSFISLLITDLDILASFLLTHHTVRTNCLNFGVPASMIQRLGEWIKNPDFGKTSEPVQI
ncbi:hypothetical protein KKE14_01670, partial [Patescibacteria group bacterium]|nr:hypothetical protein [Patescibacteria group bacterium]